ncbi:MAG: 16S rRNA (adenine(1518)-N(6)/adenine(1519)-N(6))-dimethyltransferase RsmA [Fimbriimonas sp.]
MRLTEPADLKPFLLRHGIRAEKGLGQHFLVSARVVDSIALALDGCVGLLEIGPGPGVLTAPLSARAERMIALEIDPRMEAALAESAPRAEVRRVDALKSDLSEILRELPEPRAIVSNLPYYITGPLLERIEAARGSFSKAVLMMQREVGTKILAEPGDRSRGSLSVNLQANFATRMVCLAPAGAFLPPPKVDSIVLEFVSRPTSFDPFLTRLVRMAFAQPRKTLLNNLLTGQFGERAQLEAILVEIGERPDIRPQFLTEQKWRELGARLGQLAARSE